MKFLKEAERVSEKFHFLLDKIPLRIYHTVIDITAMKRKSKPELLVQRVPGRCKGI
ncbi:hypothetical protein HOLDEFILI_01613 [Holdemania filiformis DSM 12042]|uniref:Uncharacterized protein n=1 Tax=Holdemania filiformis DSM 12042 TaxID=545696 RepID=B9Y719_9FIRM|nr:hypothetical protein HOLDEFILI_01613 [Holdemania filiformis DSM 12042]